MAPPADCFNRSGKAAGHSYFGMLAVAERDVQEASRQFEMGRKAGLLIARAEAEQTSLN